MLPNISESEWQVMRVLWEQSPRTADEVVQALDGQTAWTHRTIKTFLNRLVKKKALGYRNEGRVYHYHPIVQERDCVHAESRSFLDRVYGGALTPMLAHFIQEENLSPQDIAELKSILDRKGRTGK